VTPEDRIKAARPHAPEQGKIKILPVKKNYHTAWNKKRSEERRKRMAEKGGKRSYAHNRRSKF
jgi:hypothetical protein